MPVVVVQKWEESERGWGTRPDGYSIHPSHAARDSFVTDYWEKMPDEVPDEYSRPCGTSYVAEVSEEVYEELKKAGHGLRYYDNKYPK